VVLKLLCKCVYLLCYAAEVPLRIVGLKPSTHYLLRVRAVNDVGAGTPVICSELTENIRVYTMSASIHSLSVIVVSK